jgi:hypothetical protein
MLGSLMPLCGLSIHPAALRFDQFLFLGVLFAGMPLVFVVEIAICLLTNPKTLRFWIVRPESSADAECDKPVDACFDLVTRRLAQLGFSCQQDPPTGGPTLNLRFAKGQASPLNCFLDHAFEGDITVSPSEFKNTTHIRARIVFLDTVILQTGEHQKPDALVQYLALEADGVDLRSLSLTLTSGLMLAFMTTIVGFLACLTATVPAAWCYTLGPASVGMLFFAWLGIKKSRGAVIGQRLVVAGCYLGLAPFLSYFIGMFLA